MERLSEDIAFHQDQNALLLAHKKMVERQRDALQREYERSMQEGVNEKIFARGEVRRLKGELKTAASRAGAGAKPTAVDAVVRELGELASALVDRIGIWRAVKAANTRTIAQRYAREMERIVAQIYSGESAADPMKAAFAVARDVDAELKKLDEEIQEEHERNAQFEREYRVLQADLRRQQAAAEQLAKENVKRGRSIAILQELREQEVAAARARHELAMDYTTEKCTPSSARAVFLDGWKPHAFIRPVSRGSREEFVRGRDARVAEVADRLRGAMRPKGEGGVQASAMGLVKPAAERPGVA
jgi:hypothetical protein